MKVRTDFSYKICDDFSDLYFIKKKNNNFSLFIHKSSSNVEVMKFYLTDLSLMKLI